MKIVWNKVTTLSKTLALILFIALPFIGFCLGTRFGALQQSVRNAIHYYSNAASWPVYTNDAAGFSIAYPIDFATNSGDVPFEIVIPRTVQSQSNLSDVRLRVRAAGDSNSVTNCLTSDTDSTTANINGVPFTVTHAADAGAGNFYETTSYRTVHQNKCWTIEYIIHSTQIANYPAEYHLKPFDKVAVTAIADHIAGTFRFLK